MKGMKIPLIQWFPGNMGLPPEACQASVRLQAWWDMHHSVVYLSPLQQSMQRHVHNLHSTDFKEKSKVLEC